VKWLLTVTLLLMAARSSDATAQARLQATEPTTLAAVMRSTQRHYPQILAAQRDIEKSQALLLATQGAFDPRIDGTLGTQQGGYYQHGNLDMGFVQAFPFLNSRVFGGYRQSDGEFAGYEGKDLTLSDGEARMGFALSLWRNRAIDDRRAAVTTADLQVQVEQHKLSAEQIKLYEQAYVAYSRWLLAHRLAENFQSLLDVAVLRGQGLTTSVAAGNAARILLVENRQAVLQRQALVTDAQRQIDVAAELLALYLRDETGRGLYPSYAANLVLPEEVTSLVSMPTEQLLSEALERRPELAIARLAQQQSLVKKRAAENLAKPQVDLRVYTTRDFGSGLPNLRGTDNVVDLNISIPLATREARGKAASAQAEIDGLQHRIQLLQDQLAQDIRAARVTIDATRNLEALAMEELTVTEELVAAEQLRFDAGQSDFFLLNQRERQMGEALLKRWQAYLTHQVALADYYAASMAVEALGASTQQ
jgi:outer membrane protein, heavy metal efflux system